MGSGEQGQNLDTIKIQIQGSNFDLSDTEAIRRSSVDTHRHISFDESCKKDDGDEVNYPFFKNSALYDYQENICF